MRRKKDDEFVYDYSLDDCWAARDGARTNADLAKIAKARKGRLVTRNGKFRAKKEKK